MRWVDWLAARLDCTVGVGCRIRVCNLPLNSGLQTYIIKPVRDGRVIRGRCTMC